MKLATYGTVLRHGEVQEWLNWHAWNACIEQSIEGSNPSLSAKQNNPFQGVVLLGGDMATEEPVFCKAKKGSVEGVK